MKTDEKYYIICQVTDDPSHHFTTAHFGPWTDWDEAREAEVALNKKFGYRHFITELTKFVPDPPHLQKPNRTLLRKSAA